MGPNIRPKLIQSNLIIRPQIQVKRNLYIIHSDQYQLLLLLLIYFLSYFGLQIIILTTCDHMQTLNKVVQRITNKIGRQNFAILLICYASLTWPIGFLYVTHNNVPVFETMLVRGATVLVTHYLICRFFGIDLNYKSWYDLKYLLIRSTVTLCQNLVYTWMYFVVSFPIVNTIYMSAPLFVFVIDYYMNGVTINHSQKWGIILGFIGVLITINGDAILSIIDQNYHTQTQFQHYIVDSVTIKVLLSLFLLAWNIPWAYAMVIQKKIKHLPGIKISYFMGIQFTFFSGIVFSTGKAQFSSNEPSLFIYSCVFTGIILTICQIAWTSGLNMSANSGKLTMSMFLYPLTSYAISIFKYHQSVNAFCIAGIALIGFGLKKVLFPDQDTSYRVNSAGQRVSQQFRPSLWNTWDGNWGKKSGRNASEGGV